MTNGKNLDFLFSPASVAVIGASATPGKLSYIIIKSLKSSGFKGAVYPVNPAHAEVAGLKCYPRVADIGGVVDLAVFALPAPLVPRVLAESAGRIRGAVVISGGFGEMGDGGKALEKELRDIAKKEGVRIIGPNCMGVYDSATGLDTFFVPSERLKRPGSGGLSIISQSGSFAVTAMDELAGEGVGISKIVSYGNKVDVNEPDLLDYLAGDDSTTAVAMYVEAIEEGRRFVEAASRCSSRKPVMALKVGRFSTGKAAALSHTGALAGRSEIYSAAFRKAGVIEVSGYEEFIGGCKALSMKKASGGRVVIITDGGGIGVGLADACAAAGLDVAPLDETIVDELKAVMPPYFTIGNPMDLTGSATDDLYAEAIEKTLSGGFYDMAIVAALWGPPGLTDELPGLIAEKSELTGKPVIVSSPGGEYTKKKMELFRKKGLPVFTTPESAVRAASLLSRAASRGAAKLDGQ